jgi:opacity protein-like surface antigen
MTFGSASVSTSTQSAGAMRWMALAALAIIGSAQWVAAEELNLKETPETTTVALTPFSLGVEVGGLAALNDELRDKNETFFQFGIASSIIFADHFAMGLNFDWFVPGSSMGGGLTLDYILGKGAFRPFAGAGVGLHRFDNDHKFSDEFGISGTVHAGLLFDVMDELQLRVRVPLYMVANKNYDQLAGVDFALLFSNPLRNTRVKKLTY